MMMNMRHPCALGKGSTVALIAAAMRAAGYKVGLYTSPHMHHISERISTTQGGHIKPEDFDALVGRFGDYNHKARYLPGLCRQSGTGRF